MLFKDVVLEQNEDIVLDECTLFYNMYRSLSFLWFVLWIIGWLCIYYPAKCIYVNMCTDIEVLALRHCIFTVNPTGMNRLLNLNFHPAVHFEPKCTFWNLNKHKFLWKLSCETLFLIINLLSIVKLLLLSYFVIF